MFECELMEVFLLFLVTEDPYYCGLSARTPKFEKTTLKKQSKNQIAVPKRMSVAYLQHPVSYVAGYQYASHQQLMPQRQHFQMMWQARSMESGLGKKNHLIKNSEMLR